MAIDIQGIDYQFRLLALMMKQDEFLHTSVSSLKVLWFETPELQAIAQAILDYYAGYKKAPGRKDLTFWIKQYVTRDPGEAESYKSLLKSIEEAATGSDLSFVRGHYQEFVTYRSYRAAILASTKALDDQAYDTIPVLIREAQTASSSGYGGLDYFEDPFHRLTTKLSRDTVSTGIPQLDDVLGGGHARKELTVVMAPSNRGKTLFLINLGYAAVRNSLCVLHLFAEQSQELIAARYDSRILGRPINTISTEPKKSTWQLKKFGKDSKGSLFIVDCRNWTVERMRSYIYQMKDQPDVVIVDYADKLVAARKYNNYRHELVRIYDDLITLGRELNISILTASQTNRAALSKKTITMDDIDEEFGKVKASDTLLALCQTDQEKQSNDMRVYTAKVRNEQSGKTVECKIFYDLMRVVSRVSHVQGSW